MNAGDNLRDCARGFGAEQIDNLMRDAWVDGYWKGANEYGEQARAECREAERATRQRAEQKGCADAFEWLWVNSMRRIEEAEDMMLRSLLRRLRGPRPARLIMVDERGRRLEYVHDPADPIWWLRADCNEGGGYLAIESTVSAFLANRATPPSFSAKCDTAIDTDAQGEDHDG